MDRWMVREGDSLPLASESVFRKGKGGKEKKGKRKKADEETD
jgi:hypothetical protein